MTFDGTPLQKAVQYTRHSMGIYREQVRGDIHRLRNGSGVGPLVPEAVRTAHANIALYRKLHSQEARRLKALAA